MSDYGNKHIGICILPRSQYLLILSKEEQYSVATALYNEMRFYNYLSGRLIFLVGTSSSGKSSTIQYIQENQPFSSENIIFTGTDAIINDILIERLLAISPKYMHILLKHIKKNKIIEYVVMPEKFMLDINVLHKKNAGQIKIILQELNAIKKEIFANIDTYFQRYCERIFITSLVQGKIIIVDTIDINDFLVALGLHFIKCHIDTIIVYCPPKNLAQRIMDRNKVAMQSLIPMELRMTFPFRGYDHLYTPIDLQDKLRAIDQVKLSDLQSIDINADVENLRNYVAKLYVEERNILRGRVLADLLLEINALLSAQNINRNRELKQWLIDTWFLKTTTIHLMPKFPYQMLLNSQQLNATQRGQILLTILAPHYSDEMHTENLEIKRLYNELLCGNNMKQTTKVTLHSKKPANFANLRREWNIWTNFFGKILIIHGPSSSGKSTLLFAILKRFPNCVTINRKKIQSASKIIVTKFFFTALLKEASLIIGREISSLSMLYTLGSQEIPKHRIAEFNSIKRQIKQILATEQFKKYSLQILFSSYYEESKQVIFSGYNLLIDETLLDDELSYEIFCSCYNFYPKIKSLILFNTLDDLLEKYITRNNKFISFSQQHTNNTDLLVALSSIEVTTGASSLTYRAPVEILGNYRKFYDFTPTLCTNNIPLARITRDELFVLINRINEQQLRLIQILDKFDVKLPVTQNYINPLQVINEIFATTSSVYILSKRKYDFVVHSSQLQNLTLLSENMAIMTKFLASVLEWLDTGICAKQEATPTMIFSKIKPKDAYLIEHRHENKEIQNMYDKRFGLLKL